MASSNAALVGRILLVSAVVFVVLAALSWTGTLPIDPMYRRLFSIAFGICAVTDVLIGLLLLVLSRHTRHELD